MESVLISRRLAAIAALLDHHGGTCPSVIGQDPATVTGYERTCADVAALMNLAPAAASHQVHYAEALDTRLPRVGELFAEGRLDWRTVQIIIFRTDLVDVDLIAELDEELAARAERWHSWSRRRIINTVDAAVLAVDPDAARQRRKDADDDRYIWIGPDRDGMAEINGKVAAAQGTAFDRRLTQLANDVCADDPRSLAPSVRHSPHRRPVWESRSSSTSSPPKTRSPAPASCPATWMAMASSTPSKSGSWPRQRSSGWSTAPSTPSRRCATSRRRRWRARSGAEI
jgi:hypothetical protein